jgi:hypothetical protein
MADRSLASFVDNSTKLDHLKGPSKGNQSAVVAQTDIARAPFRG